MFKYQPDNGNPMYGTVVDEKTVVLGSEKKMITTALAAAAAENKKPAINKDLATLIGKMDDKASVWVAAVLKGKLDNAKLPGGPAGNPKLQDQLANLETVTLVIKITGDVTLDVNMAMSDAKAAEEMGAAMEEMITTIKGLLPFLVAQNPQAKPLQDTVKTLKSTVKDKTVTLTGKMTGATIGALLKMGD